MTAGGERSAPFFIQPDVWKRTLPEAVSYHRAQRCVVAVPGVHPACHLDDARRCDNGQYVDLTGGWHDAGDLRKWMSATMTNGFGLLHLSRNLGDDWDGGITGTPALLEEMRWGNRYFLQMQDSDGRIWADVAGGVNGNNSDNHWTDNEAGNMPAMALLELAAALPEHGAPSAGARPLTSRPAYRIMPTACSSALPGEIPAARGRTHVPLFHAHREQFW